MRLLFVKLKHIGDALLLTPTLTAARASYPQARIWVVVRRGTEGILGGCTAIDELRTAAAPEAARRSRFDWWRDLRLSRELRRQRFDHAFELSDGDRGRWLCWLSGARHRGTNLAGRPLGWWWERRFDRRSAFAWQNRHRVEKDFYTVHDCLPLEGPVPPLSFSSARASTPSLGQRAGAYAVVHAGTRWKRKRWPLEKWVELGRWLGRQVPQMVLSVGPDPEEVRLAAELRAAWGAQTLSTEGRLSWAGLAGLLYGARLFVGVDTAAMHLAAACQCPTVAIFGPSNPVEWAPWRVEHRLVRPPPEALVRLPPQRQIEAVEFEEVRRACAELLNREPG